ncbi:hypothetical protein I550_0876 [Mycobacterium intracellulare 1956]|uniref:Uncharacterized protein n=1 Tax=Mycobacterium intracellulare 1956 TaxID=1299331 RepID=X8CQL0_MYCIT|nr:hypothetical protein I548_3844 [Mycobacterium intracellulare]EUA57748.1 hypothetical protein I550_0876 [Mycobacterium intracellulare 1956]
MIATLFAAIAVLGTAVVYGTDVFCAVVQRPALARVDDRAMLAVMGNIHRYGDRRMPVPGPSAWWLRRSARYSPRCPATGRKPVLPAPPSACCWCGCCSTYE